MLQRDPGALQTRLATWMKQCVSSMQSTCQSSVMRAPQRFGHLDQVAEPLPFSKTERSLTRYDGGSEIDAMRDDLQRDGVEPTEEQSRLFEDAAEKAAWSRPDLPLKAKSVTQSSAAGDGKPKPGSTYSKVVSEFAVFTCPDHRRRGALHRRGDLSTGEQSPHSWEQAFTEDVRSLAEEILVHVCGESCFKYSGVKVQKICRHGYYYIISLPGWQRRRQGKPLRNAVVVVGQSEHGMTGRLLLFQEHPFECLTNYAGLDCMRCNLDVQDLLGCSKIRRVVFWRCVLMCVLESCSDDALSRNGPR